MFGRVHDTQVDVGSRSQYRPSATGTDSSVNPDSPLNSRSELRWSSLKIPEPDRGSGVGFDSE